MMKNKRRMNALSAGRVKEQRDLPVKCSAPYLTATLRFTRPAGLQDRQGTAYPSG
jgi:hypothetical protein